MLKETEETLGFLSRFVIGRISFGWVWGSGLATYMQYAVKIRHQTMNVKLKPLKLETVELKTSL